MRYECLKYPACGDMWGHVVRDYKHTSLFTLGVMTSQDVGLFFAGNVFDFQQLLRSLAPLNMSPL